MGRMQIVNGQLNDQFIDVVNDRRSLCLNCIAFDELLDFVFKFL